MIQPRYLLDTNTVGDIIRGNPPAAREHLRRVSPDDVCIAAITEAELRQGLARKPEATSLRSVVEAFIRQIDIEPWDSECAKAYVTLCIAADNNGGALSTMDMLIAASAYAADAILVTSDPAFSRIGSMVDLADWSRADDSCVDIADSP